MTAGAGQGRGARESGSRSFAFSLALHAAIAVGAFIYAARVHQEAPPAEELLWIEMGSADAKLPARPPEPPKPPDPAPKAATPAPAPPPAVRPAAVRTGGGTPRLGSGPARGGLGVLAGDGPGDGFEMNAEPGDGDGLGQTSAPAPPPPPPPPPPPSPPARPKEPPCDATLTKPRPLAKPRSIEYPESARADGKEGRLLLQLTVGEDGTVGQVDVLSSVHPALDAAAIAAVKTWRFEPAQRCGKPAAGTYRVARRFELGD